MNKGLSLALVGIALLGATLTSCKKETLKQDIAEEYQFNQNIFLPNENGDSAWVADPHVIKAGDKWYLYGTRKTGENFEAWSTDDLLTWEYEGVIWRPTAGSWNDRGSYWAPAVYMDENGYYLHYSANGKIGVAYAETPTGPFTEVYDHPLIGGGYGGVGDGIYLSSGLVTDELFHILDSEEHAIDAHVFKASDGSLTLYFTPIVGFPVISAIPMINPLELADVKPKVLVDVDFFSWEVNVREAPFMIEKDGRFHLLYSGNYTSDDGYAMGVATGSSPLGQFTKRTDNPILRSRPLKGIFGPGHCSVVEGKYGDWLIFYHSRDQMGTDARGFRKSRYLPLTFDAQGNIRIDVP